MVVDAAFLIGLSGMVLILAGFLLLQRHYITADSLSYDLFNALGSIMLVGYGISTRAWPFVLLNGVFGMYSFWDVLFVDVRKRRENRERKTEHEDRKV
jgi:hypothetical protein